MYDKEYVRNVSKKRLDYKINYDESLHTSPVQFALIKL